MAAQGATHIQREQAGRLHTKAAVEWAVRPSYVYLLFTNATFELRPQQCFDNNGMELRLRCHPTN